MFKMQNNEVFVKVYVLTTQSVRFKKPIPLC